MRLLVLLALAACCATTPVLAGSSADQEVVSVVDSPDPIVPGQDLTYTVTVRNNGPNAAVNGGLNVNLGGGLTLQTTASPAGFTCTAFGSSLSCTNPSFAPGTAVITLVARVDASLLNFPDTSINSNFTTSGTTPDPNNGNNAKSATTAVDSPQVDLSVSVTDSPDPVGPDQNITYTATVANAGPDAATNASFNVFHNNGLSFQSAVVPAGFSCALPNPGAAPIFTCTAASFAPGNSVFTVVVRADDDVLGINDGTLQTAFGFSGTGNETNQANNAETESTAYVTPDADVTVSVTDSPDPVFPNGDITYTVTVGNSGPDPATSFMLNTFNNGSLRFRSVTSPAGFSCTPPALNAAPTFTCTAPSVAAGASSVFTIVVRADPAILGLNDGTVQTAFSVSSARSDPVPANNSETETTAYVTPDADVSVSVLDSPDPAVLEGAIDYLVTVANNGPDTATSFALNVFNNGSLQFVSVVSPVGFSCTAPNAGAAPTFTCTTPSLGVGVTRELVIGVRADEDQIGAAGGTVSTNFSVASGVADPAPANNSETETTLVRPDRLLSDGFE
jgi:uncharacterized repeat protein (TIGR01451 family)